MDDITETNVEMNVEPSLVETWKSQIDMTWKTIQWLENVLGSFDTVVDDCMQQLVDLRKKLYNLGAPKSTNVVETGPIS